MNKFLVLGNGIAGFSAAAKIRELREDAEITIVSAENESTYLRPLLSKTDFRTFQRDKARLVSEQWYRDHDISVLKNARVECIDRQKHVVSLSDGRALPYDKCVYALGADCFVPPIPGTDKKGVLTLRTTADFRELRRRAVTAKSVVLIGGGIIGLEMAWELYKMGIACTILEAAPRLMGRQLDAESSALLMEHIRSLNIACYADVQVTGLTGDEKVTGVQLADGRWFPGDMVILSTGVRPVTAPAIAAGIVCDRGVVVDDTLMTNDPDIYAAGDCIKCSIPNPGLWKYARVSGEIAGHNAVHPEEPLDFSVGCFPVVLTTMGTGLFALGNVTEGGSVSAVVKRGEKSADAVPCFRVNRHDGDRMSYQKRFYCDGRLCGAVLLGDISDMYEILDQLG